MAFVPFSRRRELALSNHLALFLVGTEIENRITFDEVSRVHDFAILLQPLGILRIGGVMALGPRCPIIEFSQPNRTVASAFVNLL